MRRTLTQLFRFVLRIFFVRIQVLGLEYVPNQGPVVIVLNHPNGLLDPLFVLCFVPRAVSFLAKAPLFTMPMIGRIVRAFDSLPVYRRTDGNGDPTQNRRSMEAARQLLGDGGTLAIFPEGASHSDPRLRPLKTGAARIALCASADPSRALAVTLIPAGLFYTAKSTFRSSALLQMGAPIAVPVAPVDDNLEPPRETVQMLTQEIERALAQVTLQAESQEALALVNRAERLFRSQESLNRDMTPVELFELRKKFIEGYTALRERFPARIAALVTRVRRHDARLLALGVDPHTLDPKSFAWPVMTRYVIKSLLYFLLLAPLACMGIVIHYPAYRLIDKLAVQHAKGEEDVLATVKLLAALLLFPATWLLAAALVATGVGGPSALVLLALAPPSGYAALVFSERLVGFYTAAQAFLLFLRRRGLFDELTKERQAIADEIINLGRNLKNFPSHS